MLKNQYKQSIQMFYHLLNNISVEQYSKVPTVRCGLSRQNETTELFFGRTDENNGEFSYGKGGNIRGNQAGPGVKDKWRHSLKKTSTLFKRLRSLK
ncbi:uncharacterized protein OCT59_002303 [Rhizophagus irregularis]|uniref:uncharacterized protein n=1 Tax=Rhizophagus irregularis TaxID=588596 RepID=UPI0019FE80E3|nr:hypothetical protein OCT59_002303 [Rhizophagus irregularis]GBC47040.2 hypothetical protein RIR_jg37765.t1 [Rhizophagus irregularis DAOM 181602=DAOM 197198]